jgi:DNA polymerase III epsilon subunit-like protein
MYVLVLDTETTGLFPRGAASTPLQPPLCPSAPRGAASTPEGASSTPLRPPPRKSFTEGAPILNPSTQGGFRHCVMGSAPLPLPYAVQISYAIIDTSSPVFPIVEDYDAIIRISETTPLPEESVKIHGITREMIRAKGVPIEHVLSILQRSLDTYDIQLVVGHNIAFDLRVLDTERGRQAPPSTPPCIKGRGRRAPPIQILLPVPQITIKIKGV